MQTVVRTFQRGDLVWSDVSISVVSDGRHGLCLLWC